MRPSLLFIQADPYLRKITGAPVSPPVLFAGVIFCDQFSSVLVKVRSYLASCYQAENTSCCCHQSTGSNSLCGLTSVGQSIKQKVY